MIKFESKLNTVNNHGRKYLHTLGRRHANSAQTIPGMRHVQAARCQDMYAFNELTLQVITNCEDSFGTKRASTGNPNAPEHRISGAK